MNDPELIELRNKFLLGIVIAVIFCTPLFIFMNKSFGSNESKIYKMMKQRESFVVFTYDKKCDTCDGVKNMLDKKKLPYFELNVDKAKDLDKILKWLNINSEIESPGLIYVKDGFLGAYIFDIKTEEDVNDFIKLNKLGNVE